jgi:hypothetical protein
MSKTAIEVITIIINKKVDKNGLWFELLKDNNNIINEIIDSGSN